MVDPEGADDDAGEEEDRARSFSLKYSATLLVDVVRLSSESEGVGVDEDGGVGAGVGVDSVDIGGERAIPRISAMADADLPEIRFAALMRAR